MTEAQRLANLSVPQGPVDVVLDTDAFNEIDDQFALAYLLRSKEKLNTVAVYAAPFFNHNSTSPKDGMEKSYIELQKILSLAGESVPTFRGAENFLKSETEAVYSPAVEDLVQRARNYSPEHPLFVVAIGAITNIASAILADECVKNNTVVVWLGGQSLETGNCREFNLMQDVAAARVVMGSGVPLVQLPCEGVVRQFSISKPELEYWFMGKNPLADYLARNTVAAAERYAKGLPWTRTVWDVTAVAWLLNEVDRFMLSRLQPTALPSYSLYYEQRPDAPLLRYVYNIRRDALWADVIEKITGVSLPEEV